MTMLPAVRQIASALVDAHPPRGGDSAVVNHLLERVTNTDTMQEPYEHMVVDNFLPPEIFLLVEEQWPADAKFAPVRLPSDSSNDDKYLGSRRSKLIYGTPRGAKEPTQLPEVWQLLSDSLRNPRFVLPLLERFDDTIAGTMRHISTKLTDEAGFRLYACQDFGAGDALGAHVDALRKFLTIVIYIDLKGPRSEESDAVWGTALYSHCCDGVRSLEFRPNSTAGESIVVRFAPNRAFIMPNQPRALHGVAGGEADVQRRTVMCGYWLFDPEA